MIRAVTIAQQKDVISQSNQWCKRLMTTGTKKEHDFAGRSGYNPGNPLWIMAKHACRALAEV
jgi:hypothetical protein